MKFLTMDEFDMCLIYIPGDLEDSNWVPPHEFWLGQLVAELDKSSVYAWAVMLPEPYQIWDEVLFLP